MPEDFRSFMQAAASEQAGDTSSDTPQTPATETLAAQPQPGTLEPETSSADKSTDTGSDDTLRSYLEATKAAHPDQAEVIDRLHREMQGAFTPKLQEAAELRKQFEGIDPADVQFIRQVNELALVNPQAAKQMLDNAGLQLVGNYAPVEAASQPEDWEFATPMEQRQYQELQELKAWREQEMTARTSADMDRQFAEIGKEFGSEVPFEQRRAVARYCLDNQIAPAQIGLVWKGLYGLAQAKQNGRNEAAQFVERKSAMTPGPSGIANPPAAPPGEPKSTREALERAYGIT